MMVSVPAGAGMIGSPASPGEPRAERRRRGDAEDRFAQQLDGSGIVRLKELDEGPQRRREQRFNRFRPRCRDLLRRDLALRNTHTRLGAAGGIRLHTRTI